MKQQIKFALSELEKQGFKFSVPYGKWNKRGNMRECFATYRGSGCYIIRLWEDSEDNTLTIETFELINQRTILT